MILTLASNKAILFGGRQKVDTLLGKNDLWLMVLDDSSEITITFKRLPVDNELPYWGGAAMLHPKCVRLGLLELGLSLKLGLGSGLGLVKGAKAKK